MNSNKPNEPGGNRGGKREGAGRPAGAVSKMSKEAREKAQATGILPHEFLLQIVRGEPIFRTEIHPITGQKAVIQEVYGFEDRKDAAKAAAPYYAPKISTVEVIHGVSDHELDSIIARAAAEAGVSLSPSGEGTTDQASDDTGGSSRQRVRLQE